MKFKNVKDPQQKNVQRFIKIIFPIFWLFLLWRCVPQKKQKLLQIKESPKKKRALGLIIFSSFFFLGKKILHLKFLAFDKKNRGKGYGSESLKKLQEKATKSGHNFIVLFSGPFRKKAHNFYRKNGFKQLFKIFFWKKIK